MENLKELMVMIVKEIAAQRIVIYAENAIKTL
jgi:hypothetical protein